MSRIIKLLCLLLAFSALFVACTPDDKEAEEAETSTTMDGFDYDDFVALLRERKIDTVELNERNGVTEATFRATGADADHVYVRMDCAPTQIVLVEFYGKSTHTAYDPEGQTGGLVIVEFFDEEGNKIGDKYNGYVLGETECGYHKYGFVAPHGTKTARLRVVTRAESDITLHSLTAAVLDEVPKVDREGLLLDAHLGMILVSPRNTLGSFELAGKAGFSHCITNCNWTKDGVLVALHNDTVDETSNGTGNVHDMTYEELQSLDFGGWFSENYVDTPIPKLSEVVALMAEMDVVPIFRLHNAWKTEESRAYLEQIYAWIVQYGWQGKAGVKAFGASILENAYAVMGDDVEYLLCGELTERNLQFYDKFEGKLTIEFPRTNFDVQTVKDAAARGVRLSSYIVNDMAQMRELMLCGVTRFCTDTYSDIVFPME